MKTLPALLLSSSLVLAACGGAGMHAYEPVQQKTQYDQEQLFGASQKTIEKLGYFPTKLDHGGHTVSTREKEVGYSSVPRLSYKYSFKITTTGGVLNIEADCKMNSSMSREKFDDCGEERPKQVVEEMENLKEKILEMAKTMPAMPKFDEPVAEEPPPADAPKTTMDGEPVKKEPSKKPSGKKDSAAKPPAEQKTAEAKK